MKLSDAMSAMQLAIWAEVALVIFFVVFLAIAVRVLCFDRQEWTRARSLPLEPDEPATSGEEERHD